MLGVAIEPKRSCPLGGQPDSFEILTSEITCKRLSMCGIAGIFSYRDGPPVDREELLRIREAMIHRGPDGAGLWLSSDNRVGLAHRRLAIIDLSDTGAQPMATDDGQLRITFNGEIYNYRALRKELEAKGVRFHSESDTEVLLHLYADRGMDMVHALRGMYAFGIWDERKKGLLLARDPFGIKPLYYTNDGATLRFASQVKALAAGGGVNLTSDPAGLITHDDGLSDWYVTMLAGYPIVDTLFAMYRRGIVRRVPLWNPTLHLHLLVFRRVVMPIERRRKGSNLRRANARVAPRLWLHSGLCLVVALVFHDNTPRLWVGLVAYAAFYVIQHRALVLYRGKRIPRRADVLEEKGATVVMLSNVSGSRSLPGQSEIDRR